MGMYTGIRFKGIIREHFKQEISRIFDKEDDFNWANSENPKIADFGKNGVSFLINNSNYLPYMPWDGSDKDYNGFNKKTGELNFQCSIKNYNGELDNFIKIAHLFTEKLYYCEIYYEEWVKGRLYTKGDGIEYFYVLQEESWEDFEDDSYLQGDKDE